MKDRLEKVEESVSSLAGIDASIAAHLTGSIGKLVANEKRRGEDEAAKTAIAALVAVFGAMPEHAQKHITGMIDGYLEAVAKEREDQGFAVSSMRYSYGREAPALLPLTLGSFFRTGELPKATKPAA